MDEEEVSIVVIDKDNLVVCIGTHQNQYTVNERTGTIQSNPHGRYSQNWKTQLRIITNGYGNIMEDILKKEFPNEGGRKW